MYTYAGYKINIIIQNILQYINNYNYRNQSDENKSKEK